MGIKFNPFTGDLDIVNNLSIDGRVVNFILGQGSSVTIRWSTTKNGWIFISTF